MKQSATVIAGLTAILMTASAVSAEIDWTAQSVHAALALSKTPLSQPAQGMRTALDLANVKWGS